MEGGLGDWRMKTSSSRTDEWIWTEVSSDRNLETEQGVSVIPSLIISVEPSSGFITSVKEDQSNTERARWETCVFWGVPKGGFEVEGTV
jgi:hypothetical protein